MIDGFRFPLAADFDGCFYPKLQAKMEAGYLFFVQHCSCSNVALFRLFVFVAVSFGVVPFFLEVTELKV